MIFFGAAVLACDAFLQRAEKLAQHKQKRQCEFSQLGQSAIQANCSAASGDILRTIDGS
jgi:hypothetical protein